MVLVLAWLCQLSLAFFSYFDGIPSRCFSLLRLKALYTHTHTHTHARRLAFKVQYHEKLIHKFICWCNSHGSNLGFNVFPKDRLTCKQRSWKFNHLPKKTNKQTKKPHQKTNKQKKNAQQHKQQQHCYILVLCDFCTDFLETTPEK